MALSDVVDVEAVLRLAAGACFTWCVVVLVIESVGIMQIFRSFSSRPPAPISPSLEPSTVPHVTVLRPVAGLEPELRACLVSCFRQTYPPDKLSIRLCIESESDPAYPLLEEIVRQFPGADAQILVQDRDGEAHVRALGPNRKVRNLSRAYREAKDEIIWMLDSNVWVGRNTAGRMVDKLMGIRGDGSTHREGYKLVHQLPIVADTLTHRKKDANGADGPWSWDSLWRQGGSRLDEMFIATTHAKFYTSFNTVGAPCIVGKSNMFRKLDLEAATLPHVVSPSTTSLTGLDYFSSFICEDHLIGEKLWQLRRPGVGNHGIMLGDLVVQPMRDMSIQGYVARRVRWLRARKWTVLLATWVEPGIESLLWSTYFSWAVTTLSLFDGIVSPTWGGMAGLWWACIIIWALVDWHVFNRLHSGLSVEVDEHTPAFASGALAARGPGEWTLAWIGREVLALPIWSWAFYRPTVVTWRGKQFRVARDMSVIEVAKQTEVAK